MSVHNGMPYLERALESILAQTVADIEAIVVDDGSTDGSMSLVAACAGADSRVKLLTNGTRSGQSAGLNKAAAAASARWLAVLDADDVALPNRMERQLDFVARHPEVKVAGSLAYYIDAAGRRIGKAGHDLATLEVFRRYMERDEAIGFIQSGAIIESATFERVGGYRTEFEPANDNDLWNRISEIGPILIQQEYLVEYRVHSQSLSAQSFLTMRMKYDWIRTSMRARRRGDPEPAWQEFLRQWNAEPVWRRINRQRKIGAKRHYRQAGLNYACGRPGRAAVDLFAAMVLQPAYALPRLKEQWLLPRWSAR
jgi:glycosyltransferase involved in cell wall biosynthesis